jgi:pimeloyl-ACP methyl ester carboxylesterase
VHSDSAHVTRKAPLAICVFMLVAAALLLCACFGAAQGGTHKSLFSAQAPTASASTSSSDDSGALEGGTEKHEDYKKRVVWFKRGKNRIYSELYLPEGVEDPELVVMCHGLGGDVSYVTSCAKRFVKKGYAVLALDFCGGGPTSRSDGETTDMSIMTEVADLEAVLDQVGKLKAPDTSQITLFGESQGGVVASIVAARQGQNIKRLILFYPAYSLIDDLHYAFKSLENVPERFWYADWLCLGKKYAEDIWDFKFEDVIGAYTGPVLLVHGTSDTVVDLSYSERAKAVYQNAELHYIQGGKHGFSGDYLEQAINITLDFLNRNP